MITYKNKVRSVYPNARILPVNILASHIPFLIYHQLAEELPKIHTTSEVTTYYKIYQNYLSRDVLAASLFKSKIWKLAWEQIQKDTIEKLIEK
jgi:hypothetical protein